jgi:hypothetical protein
MKTRLFSLFLLIGAALLLAGCSYTTTSVQGDRVTSSQIQEIKLARTTGLELVMLLGPPARGEKMTGEDLRLVYAWTEFKSLTIPGGYQAVGLYDKEERQTFEVILKDGRVLSYRFIKP